LIHTTAIIDESASVASDVEIGPYSVIGAEVELGAGTVVGPHVVVKGPTVIGKNNRIFQFASVGEDPQDLKYNGERTELHMGDNNIVREYATINRGTKDGGALTKIGLAGHVNVGDHAILAGFALVHQFCTVGEHAFVGLNSVANRDVPPFMMVVGNYAEARGINKNGLRRRDFSEETIAALHRAYLAMVRQRGDRSQAMTLLQPLADEFAEVKRFINFIDRSERGIVR